MMTASWLITLSCLRLPSSSFVSRSERMKKRVRPLTRPSLRLLVMAWARRCGLAGVGWSWPGRLRIFTIWTCLPAGHDRAAVAGERVRCEATPGQLPHSRSDLYTPVDVDVTLIEE